MGTIEVVSPGSPPRKVLKRACDGCRIWKIRCSEVASCNKCVVVGIECTHRKRQDRRGPRSLRVKTFESIKQTQRSRDGKCNGNEDADGDGDGARSSSPVVGEPENSRSPLETLEGNQFAGGNPAERMGETMPNQAPLNSLLLRLCVYRLQLYPVWPIIAVEEIMTSLQSSPENMNTYALENAIGAANIEQLKLSQSESDFAAGNAMEAECQRARSLIGQKAN